MADILQIDGLVAGYGRSIVINGLSLRLPEGASLALLGRNGTGKTTLVNSIVGLTTRRAGSIRVAGTDVSGLAPEARVPVGVGWVPQERNIFRSLSVAENLAAIARKGPWTPERVFEMFPRLAERRRNMGNQLSGGEQQMLAIGRALVVNPKLILLDEPLEGLAPIIVDELLAALRRIVRDEGLSAVIVEQKARKILGFTDRAVILDRGAIVHEGPSAELAADAAVIDAHLGVAGREAAPRPAARA